MLKHHITKYTNENGNKIAVAWTQLNVLGHCYCFNIREITL
mgnify:CR=1 FL=1